MNKIENEIKIKKELNKRFNEVVKWGEDRKLYQNSNPLAQAFKLAEETGELITAFNKDKEAEFKDAVGDCLVVALHLLKFAKRDGVTSLFFDTKPKPVGAKFAELFIQAGIIIERLYDSDITTLTAFHLTVEGYISDLCELAKKNDIDPVECLDLALQEIKSRKGYFNNLGIFVKEGGGND